MLILSKERILISLQLNILLCFSRQLCVIHGCNSGVIRAYSIQKLAPKEVMTVKEWGNIPCISIYHETCLGNIEKQTSISSAWHKQCNLCLSPKHWNISLSPLISPILHLKPLIKACNRGHRREILLFMSHRILHLAHQPVVYSLRSEIFTGERWVLSAFSYTIKKSRQNISA